MKIAKLPQLVLMLFLIAVSLQLSSAQTVTVPVPQMEIRDLLSFVGKSGCAFFRNGNWYGSLEAQQHLQKKWDYAVAISSAEQFIDRIGTASSFSNQPYQVRCSDGIVLPSSVWLRNALTRNRANSSSSSR